MKKLIKQSYIHEVITMGFIINLNQILTLNKPFSQSILGNLKRCMSYINQNFLILNYMMIRRLNKDELEKNNFALLCKENIDMCYKWLNKTTYKKCLIENNQIINLLLRKSLEKLKNNMELFEHTDILNYEYLYHCLRNIEKTKYEDLRDMVYNEFLLGNLVKINILDNINIGDDLIEDISEEDVAHTLNEPSPRGAYFIQEPYVSKIRKDREYTLVLDLDETLVHYVEEENAAFVQIRPDAELFLEEVSKYYEVVIFTAAMPDVYIFILISSTLI